MSLDWVVLDDTLSPLMKLRVGSYHMIKTAIIFILANAGTRERTRATQQDPSSQEKPADTVRQQDQDQQEGSAQRLLQQLPRKVLSKVELNSLQDRILP